MPTKPVSAFSTYYQTWLWFDLLQFARIHCKENWSRCTAFKDEEELLERDINGWSTKRLPEVRTKEGIYLLFGFGSFIISILKKF